MLDYIIKLTDEFLASKPKDVRKLYGQFFTSKTTAEFMASMFSIPQKRVIRILDPGAGTGILSIALLEKIDEQYDFINEIELTCYETNDDIIPLLESNLEYIKKSSRLNITIKIINENYITSQADDFLGTMMASYF